MRRPGLLLQIALAALLLLLLNGSALSEVALYGRGDASLIASTQTGEDEMRYLGKIREAYEGKWLMGNLSLKEYSRTTYSPSGFLEWIPAALLKVFGGNFGLMLLVTDLLCTAIVIGLTWAWLKKFLTSPLLLWACMFALFFTFWGGSLSGLLRDAVPKFAQPFASLYVLLLALPGRHSLRATALRSALIGIMFYTYPYHWTLFLGCEGLLLLWQITNNWTEISARNSKAWIKNAAASFLPFAVIAAPYVLLKRQTLGAPEFADFYSRYHIVFTHIPAAPKLQAQVLFALAVLVAAMLYAWKMKQEKRDALIERYLPLLLPLVAMMVLLNANIVTGKDPEWLGHGGRVILPIATVAVFAAFERVLRTKFFPLISATLLLLFASHAAALAPDEWRRAHEQYDAWEISDERQVLAWLNANLPPEQIIAAPRSLSELIPVFTDHYLFFNASAHLFFVSLDEITDRYLGWVGLYPSDKELTETATVIVFGNHPGAQWSKERTVHNLLHPDEPFTKTMADYISRQDLRRQIDEEHAKPDAALTKKRLGQYGTEVVITRTGEPVAAEVLEGFEKRQTIGKYGIWQRSREF